MDRIVVDVTTGEVTIVPFTAEEISEIQASAAVQPPEPTPPSLSDLQAQLNALQLQIQALSGGQ